MKPVLNIEKVEGCMEWLEGSEDHLSARQSPMFIAEHIGTLVKSHAFISGQQAVAKEQLNKKKVAAYNSLIASSVANEQYFAPSLAKDFISAKLSVEQYNYDMCERCGRLLVHAIDAARSILSYLKEESKLAGYGAHP